MDMQPYAETISIVGVGSELQGVGRLASGCALFVSGALPGERVRARVVREQGRLAFGELEKVLEPSADRAAPVCPHYGRCGGCAAQHMAYSLSLELKARRVWDALERIGGFANVHVENCIGADHPWRYRNKAEYACSSGQIGLMERGGQRLIEVNDCLLQAEPSVRLMRAAYRRLPGAARTLVTRVNDSGQLMAVLGVQGALSKYDEARLAGALVSDVPELASLYRCDLKPRFTHALDGSVTLLRGEARLSERLMDFRFALSPHSFFQVNRAQAEVLVREMLSLLALVGTETVLDAYCGIGTLSLPIARAARRVIGIEIVPSAVDDARNAARENGLSNAEFVCGDAATELRKLLKNGLRPDVVVVDPPRKGLDKALIDSILGVRPQKLCYVSCDPGTLARDLKLLTASGVFCLERVLPIDMFPWTEHVETVCLLRNITVEG